MISTGEGRGRRVTNILLFVIIEGAGCRAAARTFGACVASVAIHIAWTAKSTSRKSGLWEPNWPAALDLSTPEGVGRFFDIDGTT